MVLKITISGIAIPNPHFNIPSIVIPFIPCLLSSWVLLGASQKTLWQSVPSKHEAIHFKCTDWKRRRGLSGTVYIKINQSINTQVYSIVPWQPAPPIAVTPWLLGGHKGVTAMGVGWIPMNQRDYIDHWYHHTSMRGVLYTVHVFELWHVQHIWMCFVCYKSPSRDFQRPTSPGFHFSNGQRFQFPGWGLGTRTRTVTCKWQSVDDSKFITWQRRRPGLTTKNAHSAGGSGESLNVKV